MCSLKGELPIAKNDRIFFSAPRVVLFFNLNSSHAKIYKIEGVTLFFGMCLGQQRSTTH